MLELWTHQKEDHLELTKKFICEVADHAHLKQDSYYRCMKRNKPNVALRHIVQLSNEKKESRTVGMQVTCRRKTKLLNRKPHNDSDITTLMEAIAEYYSGRNCLYNGISHNGIRSNYFFKATGKPQVNPNPGRKV